MREIEWTGPEEGPYRLLGFNSVPDQIMPLRPHAAWKDLNDLVNSIYRKIGSQANNQKNVGLVRTGGAEDGERIVEVEDGGFIRVDDPNNFVMVSIPGADPGNQAVGIDLRGLHSMMAGNIEALGGLGPQSETATQDRMLLASASQRVKDMQSTVLDFVSNVFKDMAWYMFYDPTLSVRGERPVTRIGDEEVMTDVNLTAEMLEGKFLDFNFKIAAYSVVSNTPAERSNAILGLLQNVLLPMLPMMEAQGKSIDIGALLKIVGEGQGLPELAEIIVDQAPQEESAKAETPQSPVKTTVNVRENRGSTTRSGQDAAKVQSLMGSGLQQHEADSIRR